MRRAVSTNPATVARRERRMMADINRQEKEWYKEIDALIAKGMSFDEAWIAAGGAIINDDEVELMRQRGMLEAFLDTVIR